MKSAIIVFMISTILISCGSNDGRTNNNEQQDHDKLIAYCYQPLVNGIHEIFRIY